MDEYQEDNNHDEAEMAEHYELLAEFNSTKVEPLNFTRDHLNKDDCLSYL